MNTQAYIESGILDEYVLGVVSPQEKQEVERLSKIYPEIKAELSRVEASLESYAMEHQRTPPARLKADIFAQMNFDEPVAESQDLEEQVEDETAQGGAQIPFGQTVSVVRPLWSRIAVAASILLAIFGGWAALQLSETRQKNEQLAIEMSNLQETAKYSETLASMYRDPNFKVIRMPGLEKSAESSVVALWNQQTNEVLLDVQSLPAAPTGKQYQLWSIVEGAPVDMGMLDQDFAGKVLRMKATNPNSVAFAITLEKEGGSPTPTMEEMYVLGKV